MRPAWAEVDLDAVRHNTEVLAAAAAPARLCAVVKADGYGHGAVPVAKAALEAGASWLAVALVSEGAALRAAGIDAPILVLSEPTPAEMPALVAADLRATLYSHAGIDALVRAAGRSRVSVHLKVDTGMHRVGAAADEVVRLAERIADDDALELEALWTHCAVADEPGNDLTDRQRARFEEAVAALDAVGLRPPMLHMANSAGALVRPDLRYDMVRCGIALYGIAPSCALAAAGTTQALRPVMSLRAKVASVRIVPAGDGVSYGWHRNLPDDTVVATVPIGYADGVPRRLSVVGGQVLLGGRRRDLAGVVTMDQLMVDCGNDAIEVGDEVVLLGAQGDQRVTAEELAGLLGTIGYEIVCGIGPRVPARPPLVITDVPGVRVGHWTDEAARTGCTVVLFPDGTVASGEVRGGAPATREFALVEPHRLVARIDAVVLSGGSAFGLAAADGVMAFCEAVGAGFPTGAVPVPIVVGMSLFDLTVGDGSVRPGRSEGLLAAEAATDGPFGAGPVGAGTGARVDKWRGAEHARPAGIGTATARDGDLVVAALMAVNAFGAVTDGDVGALPAPGVGDPFENTTIGVIATNAALDKVGCLLVAQAGHDGLARAVRPAHTRFDGDAIVAAATGPLETEVHLVQLLAARAVEEAVRSSLAP